MRELEREDRVARLERGHVDGHVRLRARVRLHVRVLGAEELLRAVDRDLLDLVDDLAAAVVAPAGIALGVLVRRHRADRLEHGRPREVLGRDQLDLPALPLELAAEQLGDLGVDLGEPGGLQVLDRLLRDGHSAPPLLARGMVLAPAARPGFRFARTGATLRRRKGKDRRRGSCGEGSDRCCAGRGVLRARASGARLRRSRRCSSVPPRTRPSGRTDPKAKMDLAKLAGLRRRPDDLDVDARPDRAVPAGGLAAPERLDRRGGGRDPADRRDLQQRELEHARDEPTRARSSRSYASVVRAGAAERPGLHRRQRAELQHVLGAAVQRRRDRRRRLGV